MIVKKEFLNKLKDLGLNSYETKLWTSLLSRGVSTAGELSDIANVPRSRTYDVLESLEKKGFIIMKIGKPIKYIAVAPSEVIERVKKKIKEDHDFQTSQIDEFKNSELLNELNVLHNQGVEMIEPTELTGAIKGRKNLYNHLEHMINGATKSIVIVSSEEGLIRKMKYLLPAMKKAKNRGAEIKVISKISDKNKFEDLQAIADIKHKDDIEGRFMVVDRKSVFFTLVDGEKTHSSYDTGVWVNSPFFAESMHSMFENIF